MRARKDIEQLETLKNTLNTAKQKYWADQVEIQRRAAAAWVAHAEGNKNEALKMMRSAAALEDASEKHVRDGKSALADARAAREKCSSR